MARFAGVVGFAIETVDGDIHGEKIVERKYRGEIVKNHAAIQAREYMLDDINVSNSFSIVCDPFANENFHHIRYVKYMGTKWKVTGVEVKFPRLILNVGGVYN